MMELSLTMLFSGLIMFSLKRKHLLLMLMSLEMIVLSIYFLMVISIMSYSSEFYFLMIFLTMSVCEGALGLSILVSIIRSHGNDYFQVFSMLW
uniref:NADH-ubiquinone oxidoreductase chain 4L n=1 Tax=Staphylinidae sp. BMNH 1274241 TaxID=1796568 RepID=A0A126TEV5_9COLE|nr:NADH dehydrogenase subunit 4L [Staphylinidae sp. BMNH 1274241]